MAFENFMKLMDYGVGIAISVAVLALGTTILLKIIIPKTDARLGTMETEMKGLKEVVASNAAQTASLTEAVKTLTETCSKVFDDNRRVIEILLNRQNGK